MRVLLVDDEVTIFVTLRDALEEAGHEVLGATDTDSAFKALEDGDPEVVVTDVRLPGSGGVAILERSVELRPERPVILMTGYATVDDAVAAMRLGAVDYVQKPFRNETIIQRLAGLARLSDLELENTRLREELSRARGFEGIVGQSEVMRGVFERVRQVATSEATVLIQGESGTGKERIARAVHVLSERLAGPFVAVNCKALAPGVLESELFGHERGAFTGAERGRPGLFERADGGTLFLDEIGEISLEFQAKLLRVLQERKVVRVSGETERELDLRVVAATNRDLLAEVEAGGFREDLYFRLAVIPIHLPPLRERPEDVLPMARRFFASASAGRRPALEGWSPEVEGWLLKHDWPGNARELENAIERGVVLARGDRIELEDLVAPGARMPTNAPGPAPQDESLRDFVDRVTAEHIRATLTACGGSRQDAARKLGIDRTTLYRWMQRLELGE